MEGTILHNLPRGQSFETNVTDDQALETACRFVQVTSSSPSHVALGMGGEGICLPGMKQVVLL